MTLAASPRRPRVYLAGFDVFRLDAIEHGARLVAACAEFGFEGLYPSGRVDLSRQYRRDPQRRHRHGQCR
jgi:nucleoside 2-deoxyribosyltransferase